MTGCNYRMISVFSPEVSDKYQSCAPATSSLSSAKRFTTTKGTLQFGCVCLEQLSTCWLSLLSLSPPPVSTGCLQAPARPPKPLPRTQPGKSHNMESENMDAKIAKLMGEGYSFEDVKRALMIAQYKVDVARNILREFVLVVPRLNI